MDAPESPCLKEKHTFFDYVYRVLVLAVPLVTAAMAMYRASLAWFIVYLVVAAGLAIVVMRAFCSHCPHYTTGDKILRCMFFREGPQGRAARYLRITGSGS